MCRENIIKIEENRSFVVTVESSSIKVLQDASEKYGIKIPEAKYLIILTDDLYEFYYQLADYGIVEYAFSLPEFIINQESGLSVDCSDEDNVRKNVMEILMGNLDNMYWGDILAEYLSEEGIEYEEKEY